MGLDAFVYCNCFETGNLKEPPPYPELVSATADGGVDFHSTDLEILLNLDQWRDHRACLHKSGILLHHRIGNITLVGLLRAELAREADKFPVLLNQVLYSGSHGGDCLSLEDVARLRNELLTFVCSDSTNRKFMETFLEQMLELADASRQVGKPISF
jgi:hypothetical protein